jgi:hypothetical protein
MAHEARFQVITYHGYPAIGPLARRLDRRRADRIYGSCRSKAWSGRSIYPSYIRRRGASRRTARLDRVGELDAGHPETFDHDPRYAQAQSLLLRITNETGQGHHVSFHRHQLVSRQQYGLEAITRTVCPYYPENRPPPRAGIGIGGTGPGWSSPASLITDP